MSIDSLPVPKHFCKGSLAMSSCECAKNLVDLIRQGPCLDYLKDRISLQDALCMCGCS